MKKGYVIIGHNTDKIDAIVKHVLLRKSFLHIQADNVDIIHREICFGGSCTTPFDYLFIGPVSNGFKLANIVRNIGEVFCVDPRGKERFNVTPKKIFTCAISMDELMELKISATLIVTYHVIDTDLDSVQSIIQLIDPTPSSWKKHY